MDYIPAVKKEIEHLRALHEISSLLSFRITLKEFSIKIITIIVKTLGVETATIYTINWEQKQLICLNSFGKDSEGILKRESRLKHKLGFGFVGWIAQIGRAEISNEPSKHPHSTKEMDALAGITAKNILCVPIILKNKNYGAIEVINKKTDFDDLDKELLLTISSYIAMTIENSELYQELLYSRDYVENVIESIPGGFIASNKDGKITMFNTQAQNILGLNKSFALGKNAKEVFLKQPELPPILFDAFINQQQQNRQEIYVIGKNDKRLLLGYGTILIKDKLGKLAGSGMIFQDITEFVK
ncbi:MAG: GAF domain-containing protein [Elusimicrobiota bacterium]|nr:GAF domain-containing protein [Elusimicrobiota bacterium]